MRRLTRFILAMLSATLLTSCASVEYVDRPFVPEIVFPIFPALDGEARNADGTVSVPGEWLVRLAEYKIRIAETEKNYTDIKAIYDGRRKKDEEENF